MASISGTDIGTNARRGLLIGIVAMLLAVGLAPLGNLGSSAATGTQYSNVQVFIQTKGTTGLSLYTLTVYNSSGSLVTSSQSNYPAFSLEVPGGSYLLTATAVNQSSPYSKYYYYSYYATEEYGFQTVQVTGPSSINLQTSPIQDYSTTRISILAKFVNGTGASGAQLSASVVGLMYWWPFGSPYNSLALWNQTGSNGYGMLTVPSVPVIVTGWDSIYVNLPTSQTTLVKNIGGENVNVTVNWQPTYVGLAGSTLIIPPTTSGEITLHAEQAPNFWYATPMMGVATVPGAAGNSETTIAGSPALMPSSAYSQSQQMQALGNGGIPPTGTSQNSAALGATQPSQIPQIIQEAPPAFTTTDIVVEVSAIGALILAASAFGILILRKRAVSGL